MIGEFLDMMWGRPTEMVRKEDDGTGAEKSPHEVFMSSNYPFDRPAPPPPLRQVYQIVSAEHADALAEYVQEELDAGWSLYGDLVAGEMLELDVESGKNVRLPMLYQTMCSYEQVKGE